MDLITALPDAFSPALLVLAGLLAFAESALGLGIVVPGEIGVLVLGAAASTPVQVLLALTVVTLAASAADHVGYLIGRRYGTRLRDTRLVRRVGTAHWDAATGLLRRRGPAALIVSRLLPLVRTLVPAAAGTARMRYHRFLAGSLVGTALWAILWVGTGALAGQALAQAATLVGRLGWIALGAVILLTATLIVWRRSRRRSGAAAPNLEELAPPADQTCPQEPGAGALEPVR